jgi:beta-phosphoglucomutase-like phosphatase (HAD superfamily)
MIRAVMFDMDGVLIDSEAAHQAALQAVLAAYGMPVPGDDDWEPVFLGRPDRDGLLDWFKLHGIVQDVHPLMADKQVYFTAHYDSLVTPHEDGQWLARALAELGIPLALVSGARRNEIELTLDRFNLRACFRASVSADDVRVGKPDPEPYLRGAAALGIDPRDTLVIEDAPAGMRAALAAGARVVVVDRYGTPELFDGITPLDRLDERVLELVASASN